MKSISFNTLFIVGLLIIIIITCTHAAKAQTIRIANNNPGATTGVNVYTGTTALQDAVNAAVSGDIIHVIPSSVSYGNLIINNKSVTILGIGLNPKKNIGLRSVAVDISLNNAGSSGSRISGMYFGRLIIAGVNSPVHTVSNVLVENCQLTVVIGPDYSNSCANFIIRNCVINSANNTNESQAFELYTTSNFVITNNIILARSPGAIQGDGLTIQNNLLYSTGAGVSFFVVKNCIVQNNIIYGANAQLTSASTGNTFQNNLLFSTANMPFVNNVNGNTATGNIVGSDPLLTNLPFASVFPWSYSYNISLLPGSPAINAGLDGTNIGPTGGAVPFDPEGTFLPLIETINAPAVVTQGTALQVNIKARGN